MILILWGAVIFRRRTIVARRRRRLVGRNRISAIYEMSTAMYDMMVFSGAIENVSENDTEYADTVTESCSFIKGDEFTEFIKWVQAAVYGRVEPDDPDELFSYLLASCDFLVSCNEARGVS